VGNLRRHPGPAYFITAPDGRDDQRVSAAAPWPPTLLKHADEQTVVGLSAILHAIAAHGLQNISFTDWGVLAAPRLLARSAMIVSLQRFLAEGAWGVSPHVIPHHSLHSMSGTISHALKMHGPNFGVGAGHEGAVEVLFSAIAMLQQRQLPGLWVVWTALEPEGEMDLAGCGDPSALYRGLAAALTPAPLGMPAIRLHVEVSHAPAKALPETDHLSAYFYLETLLNQLGPTREPGRKVGQEIAAGVRLELEWEHSLQGPASVIATTKPAPGQTKCPTLGAEVKR
jgi:hypothetical protein